ncbi:hypothetical protein SHM7688_00553 [Shimia marina]|uniref:Uncharacterized protein n=1 Tax=Shimia marina TaxID=321267 RepID=A0A0P1EKU9_9RHOB|nr:hypothetical protein SHM7688_00553 [Shimia marina]
MRGDIDRHTLGLDLLCGQRRRQSLKRRIRPRHHRQRRRIHRGNVQRLIQMGGHLAERQRNGEHPACRHRVKQLPAQLHQPQAILKGHHPRQTGSGVFPHGMPHQCRRGHPPAHPELRQRKLHHHDQRQLQARLFQAFLRPRRLNPFRQPERAQLCATFARQMGKTALHPRFKHRFGFKQIPPHADILRAAAGEHEDNLGRCGLCRMGEDTPGVAALQILRRRRMAVGHHHTPLFKGAPTGQQRMRHIRQRLLRVGPQMCCQIGRIGLQRLLRPPRDGNQLKRPVAGLAGCPLRGLIHDHMRIGAAHPKAVDASPTRPFARLPRAQRRIHRKRAGGKIDCRIGFFKAQ